MHGREQGLAPLQQAEGLLWGQHHHMGERGGKLRELPLGDGEHFLKPLPGRGAACVGDLVNSPFRVLLVALGLHDGDQPGGLQAIDRPVQADALADVDDLAMTEMNMHGNARDSQVRGMIRTALVIGGGIAGPVAALALQKAGIDAVIYEAYPSRAYDAGGGLTLAPNGLDALT